MISSNAPKVLPKADLINWLNQTLQKEKYHINRVENLGSGVGYLLLLNHIHPGIMISSKINRNPSNEYQYHANFKTLNACFGKLGITKPFDIDKLAKFKLQDNLQMLQWMYWYAQEEQKRSVSFRKFEVKVPEKIGLHMLSKIDKKEVDSNEDMNVIMISSPSRKITQINKIIRDELPTDESKLIKIMKILNLKSNRQQKTISNFDKKQFNHNTNIRGFDENVNMGNKYHQKIELTYQQHQKQSIKNAHLKDLECKLKQARNSKQQRNRRQSVKLSLDPEIFDYQQEQKQERERRLTDTSNLLQSDRKSVQSETDLLFELQ